MDRTGPAPDHLAALSEAPSRIGRDGVLRLAFERRGPRTVVTRCRSSLPLQVLAPVALDDPSAVVSILNPTGGLVGGDRLAIDIVVGPRAHACVTTPSATKIYRACGDAAVQHVDVRLDPGAILEWVPDHAIPFEGAAFRQRLDVSMGAGARLILVDAFAAGRVARGEAWRFKLLDSALRINDQHGSRFHDRFELGGDVRWSRLGFTEGASYFATVVVAGDVGPDLIPKITAAVGGSNGVRCAAAPLKSGGAVVRCLAEAAPALLEALDTLWSVARLALLGLPALALRKP
jgi:urease accessory protein